MSIKRYFHTLRYLKPGQVCAQVEHRIRRSLDRPERWNPGPAPKLPEWSHIDLGELSPPVPLQDAAAVSRGDLSFVNVRRQLDWPEEWQPEECSALWLYNLHYHDWLWSLMGAGRDHWDVALPAIEAWIENHPLGKGATGWDAYPISLRLQNWVILLFLGNRDRLSASGAAERIWQSLWKQARWLECHIEYHLRGNHLFENAVTLALLGVVFSGPDGARWKATGFRLLEEQLSRQFLADGMHFELSPMYHLRMLWLLEMLYMLGDRELTRWIEPHLTRARQADVHLRHPDGEIALLNDSIKGVYGNPAGKVTPVTRGAWALPQAGYYGFRSRSDDYIICDAGHVGPDDQPGHAHADCLNFELSVRGKRIITDTGVSDYEVSPTRAYTRSTAAHNTVGINDANQSEVWGAFRVARRAQPEVLLWKPEESGFVLHAGHSGYERLGAGVKHRRKFDFRPGYLTIRDTVEGYRPFRAVARLHLAPWCKVEWGDNNSGIVEWEDGTAAINVTGCGELKVGESPYYDQFGIETKRSMLEYEIQVRTREEWKMTITWGGI